MPITASMRAFWKCIRFWACGKMMLIGPSAISSTTSSPRIAGRQCMNFVSGLAWLHSSGFTWKAWKAAMRSLYSSSWPVHHQQSV